MRLVLRNEKDIEEIGEKIRLAREAQGMSQDDLADLMGTERVTVSRHESGTREMKIATFLQYADALNTDPALLFPDHVRTQENQSPKERLIEIIRRLPAEDVNAMLMTAERFDALNSKVYRYGTKND
jgi:transcriptional regulator with XRE-family HTH domain